MTKCVSMDRVLSFFDVSEVYSRLDTQSGEV